MCAHDWQPIPGWYARYRCTLCNVIGCKLGVVQPKEARSSVEIQPYRCASRCRGERCSEPAVHGWRGKAFRCEAHRAGHGARARRELVAPAKAASAAAVAAVEVAANARHDHAPVVARP